jgi:hypothetical protein
VPAVDELQRELWMLLLEIPGIEEGANSWGDDLALWVNGKQMANFTSDGSLEVRLSRAIIRELKPGLQNDARVTLRGSSDWVSLAMPSEEDFDFVVEMARRAAEVYLPADGTAPKPPPPARRWSAGSGFIKHRPWANQHPARP